MFIVAAVPIKQVQHISFEGYGKGEGGGGSWETRNMGLIKKPKQQILKVMRPLFYDMRGQYGNRLRE